MYYRIYIYIYILSVYIYIYIHTKCIYVYICIYAYIYIYIYIDEYSFHIRMYGMCLTYINIYNCSKYRILLINNKTTLFLQDFSLLACYLYQIERNILLLFEKL